MTTGIVTIGTFCTHCKYAWVDEEYEQGKKCLYCGGEMSQLTEDLLSLDSGLLLYYRNKGIFCAHCNYAYVDEKYEKGRMCAYCGKEMYRLTEGHLSPNGVPLLLSGSGASLIGEPEVYGPVEELMDWESMLKGLEELSPAHEEFRPEHEKSIRELEKSIQCQKRKLGIR